MSMNLPSTFNPNVWKQQLEAADNSNRKNGQDIIVGRNRLILTDADGKTWAIEVSTSGVLSAVAVTLKRPGTP